MTTEQRAFARELRHRQTSTEDLLWQQLRGRRLGGQKFRRQVPIGPYTVDFLCFAAKLVVEIDGAHHGEQAGYDERRTAEIEAQGFTVMRVSNMDVRDRLDDVLVRIAEALRV